MRGINVHAKQVVDGRDRRQLERLCRYITRPPIAQDRLERLTDGRLELRLKHAWKDGTRALVLEPDDLMVRLVAAVLPAYFHLLRFLPHPATQNATTQPDKTTERTMQQSSHLSLLMKQPKERAPSYALLKQFLPGARYPTGIATAAP